MVYSFCRRKPAVVIGESGCAAALPPELFPDQLRGYSIANGGQRVNMPVLQLLKAGKERKMCSMKLKMCVNLDDVHIKWRKRRKKTAKGETDAFW